MEGTTIVEREEFMGGISSWWEGPIGREEWRYGILVADSGESCVQAITRK